MHKFIGVVLVLAVWSMTAAAGSSSSPIAKKIARFAPTTITGDTSSLSAGNRIALHKLIEAAKILDKIYARQMWEGSEQLRAKLEADKSAGAAERLHYYNIMRGPWSRVDHDAPFIPKAPAKPEGANFYPSDMTKKEFTTWLATLPDAEQKKATGFFYTIRRDAKKRLVTVPFADEYKDLLEPAAKLLREAAEATDNASLKSFLEKRAAAFLSNDYYDSDVAWMDLDSPIEPTIGPYEVYMDELFNYKAAFEAYICLRDEKESSKLAKFSGYLQEIENNLPIEAQYRNPKLGALSPISVVDEVAIGGEARAGVQTAAFNLPNDERVTAEKGSKRVMLKNVQEAKFNKILTPLAALTIAPAQRSMIAFDPFFTHILAHELMHGLGPHEITVAGKATTARQAMKELSSALEEAKADISGLFALQYLIDKGVVEKSYEEQMYVTYLAGVFRSVRFGVNEAHGKGMAMQFNYLMDRGAITYDKKSGTFAVDFPKMKSGVRALTAEIMTLQAEGNYDGAKKLLGSLGVIRPVMKSTLARLTALPIDIEPIFPLAD